MAASGAVETPCFCLFSLHYIWCLHDSSESRTLQPPSCKIWLLARNYAFIVKLLYHNWLSDTYFLLVCFMLFIFSIKRAGRGKKRELNQLKSVGLVKMYAICYYFVYSCSLIDKINIYCAYLNLFNSFVWEKKCAKFIILIFSRVRKGSKRLDPLFTHATGTFHCVVKLDGKTWRGTGSKTVCLQNKRIKWNISMRK